MRQQQTEATLQQNLMMSSTAQSDPCVADYLAGCGRTALPGGLTKRLGDSADIMHSKKN